MAQKKKNSLKAAHKLFRHYFMVLCETEHLDDAELRKEFILALDTVKQTYKQQKGN
jgi:hypothetical protein